MLRLIFTRILFYGIVLVTVFATVTVGLQIQNARTKISMSQPMLNKRSTALDVLKSLKKTNQLAPYAGPNGVAVVTGGSSGIGVPTVETLALLGMKVVLCARDASAARKVVDNMDTSADVKNLVRVQSLDLSDLDSVKSAVDEICANEGQIDVILNNAGVMALPSKQLTAQNLEMQIGTNHVGHFYFTRLLLPYVKAGGRVTTVASTAHSMVKKLDFDDLNYEERRYTAWDAYGQSKLANILFAKGLQDRLKDEGSDVLSLCLHPGVIRTNLWRHNDNFIFRSITPFMMDKSIEQGAATNVYACLAAPETFKGGDYLVDCQVGTPNKNGKDEDKMLRDRLWEETETLIAESGFAVPDRLAQ